LSLVSIIYLFIYLKSTIGGPDRPRAIIIIIIDVVVVVVFSIV